MATHTCVRLLQAALIAGATLSTAAQAHYPWVMASSFNPGEGRTATIFVVAGHTFPLENFMDADRLERVEIVSPDGMRTPLESNGTSYATPELGSGTHLVLATQKGGFFTRTRQGNKRQSKEGLGNVISCAYSSNNMKAIINAGAGNGALDRSHDQVLEIIPLTNPADLRVGDYMDVRVTMRGEPYSGMVFATYAGFSTEGAYAYTVEPDNQGKASIRILHPGQWLVRARVEQPYPDSKVCDIEAYTTTLTFAVR